MDEGFKNLIRSSKNYKEEKEQKYKVNSKDRLFKIASKKIKTTMIGALSTLEENLGFLWGHESDEDISPEQQHMKTIFEQVRSDILDKGNTQIRNLEAEFNYYDITWLRFQVDLPVKPVEEPDKEENDG
jgi:hypothetical protein|tara:strand:+ start:12677 stop:13063 length:387 start_codon:yes stop_codon:yes gene_type:complete